MDDEQRSGKRRADGPLSHTAPKIRREVSTIDRQAKEFAERNGRHTISSAAAVLVPSAEWRALPRHVREGFHATKTITKYVDECVIHFVDQEVARRAVAVMDVAMCLLQGEPAVVNGATATVEQTIAEINALRPLMSKMTDHKTAITEYALDRNGIQGSQEVGAERGSRRRRGAEGGGKTCSRKAHCDRAQVASATTAHRNARSLL